MIDKKKEKKCIDCIKLDIYVFSLEDEYGITAVCSGLVAAVYRR